MRRIHDRSQVATVLALLGPRQSGKTTLARQFARSSRESFNEALNYFDLEDPAQIERLANPMLAHYHGQQLNASELGKSLGVADTTVSRYLDILTGTFMVRRLTPWFENIKKRQIKTPKIYFRDSGILHRLLGIPALEQMVTHPKLGASWEGFALEQVIRNSGVSEEETYY